MTEPTREITRRELHHRRINMRGFERSDGLFEVEGRITDVKPMDFRPASGVRVVPANERIHDLGVRLVFDAQMIVREVHTFIDAFPYGQCPGGGDSLQALVGASMSRGWNAEVRKRLPASETCAHLREILAPLATAAFQTMGSVGEASAVRLDAHGRPAVIDSCYAYGASREIVLRRWPAFHRRIDDDRT